MRTIIDRLSDNFVVVNLGAGADVDYVAPPEVLKALTLVELDGGNQPIKTSERYFKKHRITEFVSGLGGERVFHKRAYWGCSGLVPTKDEAIQKYGLEPFYKVLEKHTVQTRPLLDMLTGLGINRVDFLKTDLEGLDFEVIRSVEKLLPTCLAVQCELRYDPLHEGEAPCEEVTLYLRKQGFEVIGLKPEYWKPQHPNWTQFVDGNIVWADFLLLRSPGSVIELAETSRDSLPMIKHLLLAALLGKFNYACRLFHAFQAHLEGVEVNEVVNLLTRFAQTNGALLGPIYALDFPHAADPMLSVR